jgi:hypothetical protein
MNAHGVRWSIEKLGARYPVTRFPEASSIALPAVAGDLMAAPGHLTQQRAVALGEPAQREEGSLGLNLVEKVENFAHVAVDTVGQTAPLVALDHILERTDLEPVLDVDRQPVDYRAPGAPAPLGERNRIHAESPPYRTQAALV